VRSGWRGQLGSVCMAKVLPRMFGQCRMARGKALERVGTHGKGPPAWRAGCVGVAPFFCGSSWFLRGDFQELISKKVPPFVLGVSWACVEFRGRAWSFVGVCGVSWACSEFRGRARSFVGAARTP
jgi:hypothetical protein